MNMSMQNSQGNGSLPNGWEEAFTDDGKPFFIDHNTKQTTWLDPRKQINALSMFNESSNYKLPYRGNEMIDHRIGKLFNNHQSKEIQLDDPRLQFEQKKMLQDFVATARQDFQINKNRYAVKEELFMLANNKMHSLINTSATSLNSSSSLSSAKYDPDVLRKEIKDAKLRISKLRKELDQLKYQVNKSHTGIELLDNIDREVSSNNYHLKDPEALKMLKDIDHLSGCLSTAESEKKRLRQSLIRLKREILMSQRGSIGEPVIYKTSEVQTDVSGEAQQQLAELFRLRLLYGDSKKQMKHLQNELMNIENQIPEETHLIYSAKCALIKEKEKLLLEYKKQNGVEAIERVKKLEAELIAHRLECNASLRQCEKSLQLENKRNMLFRDLEAIVQDQVNLKIQIDHLSSASISSGSSLTSLSANSSRDSLTSNGQVDIYFQSQLHSLRSNVSGSDNSSASPRLFPLLSFTQCNPLHSDQNNISPKSFTYNSSSKGSTSPSITNSKQMKTFFSYDCDVDKTVNYLPNNNSQSQLSTYFDTLNRPITTKSHSFNHKNNNIKTELRRDRSLSQKRSPGNKVINSPNIFDPPPYRNNDDLIPTPQDNDNLSPGFLDYRETVRNDFRSASMPMNNNLRARQLRPESLQNLPLLTDTTKTNSDSNIIKTSLSQNKSNSFSNQTEKPYFVNNLSAGKALSPPPYDQDHVRVKVYDQLAGSNTEDTSSKVAFFKKLLPFSRHLVTEFCPEVYDVNYPSKSEEYPPLGTITEDGGSKSSMNEKNDNVATGENLEEKIIKKEDKLMKPNSNACHIQIIFSHNTISNVLNVKIGAIRNLSSNLDENTILYYGMCFFPNEILFVQANNEFNLDVPPERTFEDLILKLAIFGSQNTNGNVENKIIGYVLVSLANLKTGSTLSDWYPIFQKNSKTNDNDKKNSSTIKYDENITKATNQNMTNYNGSNLNNTFKSKLTSINNNKNNCNIDYLTENSKNIEYNSIANIKSKKQDKTNLENDLHLNSRMADLNISKFNDKLPNNETASNTTAIIPSKRNGVKNGAPPKYELSIGIQNQTDVSSNGNAINILSKSVDYNINIGSSTSLNSSNSAKDSNNDVYFTNLGLNPQLEGNRNNSNNIFTNMLIPNKKNCDNNIGNNIALQNIGSFTPFEEIDSAFIGTTENNAVSKSNVPIYSRKLMNTDISLLANKMPSSNNDFISKLTRTSNIDMTSSLTSSISNMSMVTSSSTNTIIKDESSDESTVISSQTSTLSRLHENDLKDGTINKEDSQELDEQDTVFDEEEDDDDDNLNQTIKIRTEVKSEIIKCDRAVNTEVSKISSKIKSFHKRGGRRSRDKNIRRWQTFNTAVAGDAILPNKLSRSGSDGSVRRCISNFQRQSISRQSIRLKKGFLSQYGHSYVEAHQVKTFLDLRLDLQAYTLRLDEVAMEIEELKKAKLELEQLKINANMGNIDLPTDRTSRRTLTDSLDAMMDRRLARVEDILNKMRASSDQLHANRSLFKRKMSFFTTPHRQIRSEEFTTCNDNLDLVTMDTIYPETSKSC